MSEQTKQDLIRRAVDLAGIEEVSAALKSAPSLVDAWAKGQASLPDRKLLLLTDFLIEYAKKQ
jgi:hypothetical protein